jgi:GAF domain-containing protein
MVLQRANGMAPTSGWQQLEDDRQRTISDYSLARLSAEPAFDAVSELAADLFEVPISAVTVLGAQQQMFPGAYGLDKRTTPRADAFCNITVERNDLLIVEDALADPYFRDNPLVTGAPFIRFYAGAPIRLDGVAIGSLCVIDRKPRRLGDRERRRLMLIARTVVDLMELRLRPGEGTRSRDN